MTITLSNTSITYNTDISDISLEELIMQSDEREVE